MADIYYKYIESKINKLSKNKNTNLNNTIRINNAIIKQLNNLVQYGGGPDDEDTSQRSIAEIKAVLRAAQDKDKRYEKTHVHVPTKTQEPNIKIGEASALKQLQKENDAKRGRTMERQQPRKSESSSRSPTRRTTKTTEEDNPEDPYGQFTEITHLLEELGQNVSEYIEAVNSSQSNFSEYTEKLNLLNYGDKDIGEFLEQMKKIRENLEKLNKMKQSEP